VTIIESLKVELASRPGRLEYALRVTILTIITIIISEMYQLPITAYSAYIVFFITQQEASSSIKLGIISLLAATLSIVIVFLVLMISAGEPALRLPLMAAVVFAGMFFSRVSFLGPVGFIAGFLATVMLTFIDVVPTAAPVSGTEILTEKIFWIWVAALVPAGVIIVGNILAGRNPDELLREGLSERLKLAGRSLSKQGEDPQDRLKLINAIEAGSGELLKYLPNKTISLQQISLVERLLTLVDEWKKLEVSQPRLITDAAECGADITGIAKALIMRTDIELKPKSFPFETEGKALCLLSQIHAIVNELYEAYSFKSAPVPNNSVGQQKVKSHQNLFVPDAFTNPDHFHYAIKTTLAIFIAYFLYSLHDWPGIRTCMVTCFFVTLGTYGETAHKMSLRMVGAVIGGSLGLLTIIFVMPHMTNIGDLILVIALVAFPAAWVVASSQWLSYAGLQIAMAFFVSVLVGYGPTIDLTLVRDRLVGILLGNFIVYIVFATLWPVRVATQARLALGSAIAKLSNIVASQQVSGDVFIEYQNALVKARRFASLDLFEFGVDNKNKSPSIDLPVINAVQKFGAAVLITSNFALHSSNSLFESYRRSLASWLSQAAEYLVTQKNLQAIPLHIEGFNQMDLGSYADWDRELAHRGENLAVIVKNMDGTV
jgi:multidrug resistance protein MdtO